MTTPDPSDTRPVIIHADCREGMRGLADGSVHACCTSPPYWGLRRYAGLGDDQLGLEATPEEYVANLVAVFREVRRVLRDDGVLFVVIGDSFARDAKKGQHRPGDSGKQGYIYDHGGGHASAGVDLASVGLKPKDLVGIPWMLAFALRADGWWLRSEIIWAKPNPMPESVTDRPTKSHETVFLFAKSARYFYDADAAREPHAAKTLTHRGGGSCGKEDRQDGLGKVASGNWAGTPRVVDPRGRNLRSVWTIPTEPFPGAHFAVFPRALVRPMVKAGCPEKACATCGAPWKRVVERTGVVCKRELAHQPGNTPTKTDSTGWSPATRATSVFRPTCSCPTTDTVPGLVLDPFVGSGTTCIVAWELGRRSIGFEASAEYVALARDRVRDATVGPLFAEEG